MRGRENCVRTRATLHANLARMTSAIDDTLGSHRDHLLRYARRQLRDAALAEDMVHDVLAAVIAGQARFSHRSSLRTWLIGILKHKIVDALRRRRGECSLDAMQDDDGALPPSSALSDHADPSLIAEHRQALRRAQSRLETLPAALRRTFELHVVLGHTTAEVCSAMDISQSNLWVRVHRVRKELLAA
jgi:RNA polymerase sigma-70 factor, ECF subfamily